jgi:MoaA/NifB/PqqE/SkfB family radical SAM enzyme
MNTTRITVEQLETLLRLARESGAKSVDVYQMEHILVRVTLNEDGEPDETVIYRDGDVPAGAPA